MKRNLVSLAIAITICFVVLIFASGCSGGGKKFEVDSSSYFNLTFPVGSEYASFQTTFYKVTDRNIGVSDGKEYIIGSDVVLHGENVEQLDDETLSVSKYRLESSVNKSEYFYDSLLTYENERYKMDRQSLNKKATSYPDKKDVSNAKNLLKSYVNNGYVYAFNLRCSSTEKITKNVIIDKLEFKMFDISLDFDHFRINVDNSLPKDQSDSVDAIFSRNGGGGFWGGSIGDSSSAAAVIEGTAVADIKKIDVFATDNAIVFPVKEKRAMFANYERREGAVSYPTGKDSDFKSGDQIFLERYYIFSDALTDKGFRYDTNSVMCGISFTDDRNKTYTVYDNVNTICEPGQLLVGILHNLLNENSDDEK